MADRLKTPAEQIREDLDHLETFALGIAETEDNIVDAEAARMAAHRARRVLAICERILGDAPDPMGR